MRRRWTPRTSTRTSRLEAPAEVAWEALTAAGPGPHWYADARPFVVRGAIDRVLGGAGRRWPAPDRGRLRLDDRAGFWEVRTLDDATRRLVLEAQVRAPGTVLLTSDVLPDGRGSRLRQTVAFDPDGVVGAAYLVVDLPARELVCELTHRTTVAEVLRRTA